MKNYKKILARLEAAKVAYDVAHLSARRAGEPQQGNPSYDEVGDEYCRAWDAAGVIWDAAAREEATGNADKARYLWSLLAPFDDEATTRLECLQ